MKSENVKEIEKTEKLEEKGKVVREEIREFLEKELRLHVQFYRATRPLYELYPLKFP